MAAAYSSLRWSELVALRVDRLDLVRDVIRVEEKIVESGRLIAGAPKTERSRRTVTLRHICGTSRDQKRASDTDPF